MYVVYNATVTHKEWRYEYNLEVVLLWLTKLLTSVFPVVPVRLHAP